MIGTSPVFQADMSRILIKKRNGQFRLYKIRDISTQYLCKRVICAHCAQIQDKD